MAFSEQAKQAVWLATPGANPADQKQDPYGNTIVWGNHGQAVPGSWEIDHIIPVAHGGSNHINNLQAMHFLQNQYLGSTLTKETRYGSMRPMSGSINAGVFIGPNFYSLQQLKSLNMVK